MDFGLSDTDGHLINEFHAFLDESDVSHFSAPNEAIAIHRDNEGGHEFLRALGEAGWLGVDLPSEVGGRDGSALQSWLIREELAYRMLPYGGLGLSSIAPTLARVGSARQKQRYLSPMLRGELDIVVGYTEPEAGSDLGSLRTRAVRDGDDYIVDGQKTFITGAQCASHVWLAVRTGSSDSGRDGVSILIVPLDATGVDVRSQPTHGSGQTNAIHFDGVRVPVADRIGAENKGWGIIRVALDLERSFHFAGLGRELQRLIHWARAICNGDQAIDRTEVREQLAELAADMEIARLLSLRVAWGASTGNELPGGSSMLKVWVSELRERVANCALDLMGPTGTIQGGDPKAGADGSFEQLYRFVPMMKIGGGANEIQRNIIARAALGLRI